MHAPTSLQMSSIQLLWAGMQSSRADKALAVNTLWDSLSLYINHFATQARAAQTSASAAAADADADAASEPVNTAQQQDALPLDQNAPPTTQEGPQVSL